MSRVGKRTRNATDLQRDHRPLPLLLVDEIVESNVLSFAHVSQQIQSSNAMTF
jgi:hypothetical protein